MARGLALIRVALASLALAACACSQAQTRIVVPYNAGGTLDLMARVLARHMTQDAPLPVLVENLPGAGSVIGTRRVVRAAPDGRTLLLTSSALPVAALTQQVDFDPQKDLVPVIHLATGESFLVVHSSLGVHGVADLMRVAREKPGGLNCAGIPGQMALACERLRLLTGGGVVTIPFSGIAPALNALAAGHVDLAFPPRHSIPVLLAGKQVRILAVASEARARPPFDTLPVLHETLPGMVLRSVNGIYTTAGTHAATIAQLNRELNRVLGLPEVRAWMNEVGLVAVGGPPSVLARTLAHDLDHYRKLIEDIGLKPERVQ